ncbi:CDP-glycerol glycerophosphotransferase family protein [Solibacillus sp. FSL K6-4121]|uniref:CDP-glycerol glycerophosphotransferase family protein n=1 Tax=Solibacillus sp. FSL K6-4121 TaxID=2921505 RepID=UPI0030FAF021
MKFLEYVISKTKLKNNILFESFPDVSGNSFALYKKMLEVGLNKKYSFYWVVDNPQKYKSMERENIFFIKRPLTKIEKFLFIIKYSSSKLMITENRIYPKIHKKMFWVHLTHGTPIKNTKSYMYLDKNVDLVLYQSEYVKEIVAKAYNVPLYKLVCTGYPRNDLLINMSNQKSEEEYIVWLPTFRKNSNRDRIDSSVEFPYGMPIIENENQLLDLNKILVKNNRILYIKPHFASDLSNWSKIECSNIKIIDDTYLFNQKIQLYEFLGKSKGLITDYSSVYYDYSLLKKPIALTVDDLNEYSENLGFVFENYYEEIKGFYVNNFNELKFYVENLVYDSNIEKQIEKFNYYTDNESSERLIHYLESKYII